MSIKIFRVVALAFVALTTTLMLIRDPFIQIFSLWTLLHFIIKANFSFQPHPLKTLALAASLVLGIRLIKTATTLGLADGDLLGNIQERFIVDWGIDGAPMKCGGLQQEDGSVVPTHTAVCDIWSDPEKIIDQRVERVLDTTRYEAKEMEDFLHTSTPNKRERAKDDMAEGMIV